MDRIYALQRYLYDATRWCLLPGRNALLERLPVRPGEAVLELGCGTARNLIRLARRHPQAQLFGVDASRLMLATAETRLRHAGLAQVRLAWGLAEAIDACAAFQRTEPFDHILFSYSLSMMPAPQEALARAFACLRPGGSLAVVDFGDAAGLPRCLATLLRPWLRLFGVQPDAGLPAFLQDLLAQAAGSLRTERLWRGYAFRACGRTGRSCGSPGPAHPGPRV